MAQVFVSYRKTDFAAASRIVDALKEEGISVWWDDGLTPQKAWDASIESEIAAASAVVVLWTPAAIQSEWVRTEAHYAQDRGKLIPVMLETCQAPLAFLLKQTVDLTKWNGDRSDRMWRKLLAWITDIASTKLGNANIPRALASSAQENPFRDIVGRLQSGDPIIDGAFVNSNTPAATAFRDAETAPIVRILPAGTFLIGSPRDETGRMNSEGPQRRVEINLPIAFGLRPVLRSEYFAVISDPDNASKALPQTPITNVSYLDALKFLDDLSTKTGHEYRLPSEAEWEYACRAGSRGKFSFGDTIDHAKAVYESSGGPLPADDRPANGFGLYDMHGNVREWTQDLWHESYDNLPLDGSPAIDGHGSMRVVRGGGWSDSPPLLRSASRLKATQTARFDVLGFRVVRVLN
jgi:formylglycine-generating enzyme required for sulfatase activity